MSSIMLLSSSEHLQHFRKSQPYIHTGAGYKWKNFPSDAKIFFCLFLYVFSMFQDKKFSNKQNLYLEKMFANYCLVGMFVFCSSAPIGKIKCSFKR